MSSKYDILIVGQGITGISTAFHLNLHGIHDIGLVADPQAPPTSQHSASAVLGTPLDNFTRISHAYGAQVATQVWRFCQESYTALAKFASEHKIPFVRGPRLRIAEDAHETKEMELALKQLGKRASELKQHPLWGTGLIQNDGDFAATLDPSQFLKHSKASFDPIKGRVCKLEQDNTVVVEDGSKIASEILVLAAHEGIRALVPQLEEAIIPYADQWSRFEVSKDLGPFVGMGFSLKHGYFWGTVKDPSTIEVGGARFLRKLAGIDTPPVIESKITDFLQKRLETPFGPLKATHTWAGSGIRPCDELPIIGPMFGSESLFLATGYMGTGLSLGWHAGKCLAELIHSGRCRALPRCLYPERLRSL